MKQSAVNRNIPGQGRQAMNRNMGLDRWADAPVHKLQVGACAGAQLGRGVLVCRCGQLVVGDLNQSEIQLPNCESKKKIMLTPVKQTS